jgi:tetratricopeptide (TPR) repeat protein
MKSLAIALFWSALACAQTAARSAEPPEAMALARQAYDRARSGNLDAAITDLKEAARIAPTNALYRSALGGLYEKQGKIDEAIAAFGEAVRLGPANPALLARLESLSLDYGATLARERRFRAGLVLARATAARFPQSSPVHLMLGLFETRNQQNVAAVAAYRRALQLDPDSAEASVGLGMAQSSAGLTKDAEQTFTAGIRKFPKDAVHRQAYGVLLVKIAELESATPDRAIASFESALELDPSLAESHYQLGSIALASNDAAAAAKHFAAAASKGLDDSRLHYATARALRRLGQSAEAGKHLQLFQQRKQSEQAVP